MQKAGGIIGLVAGIFGVFSAFITLLVGGLASATKVPNGDTVIGLGWGGVLFSFLVIVFRAGSACLNSFLGLISGAPARVKPPRHAAAR
jgi:hypothetical protein